MRSLIRWFLTPAVDMSARAQAVGATAVRLLVGVLWTYNVAWKVPPKFDALTAFTAEAVSHPVLAPYSFVVERVVLPNIAAFGYGVVLVELALAVTMLTGTYIRLAALLGIAQSLAIGLSVAEAPGEWPWSYLLMVGVHVLLLVSPAGRYLAVDAVRARVSDGRALARTWGAIALVVGVVSALRSLGDPLAGRGPQFEDAGLMVGLGAYNVIGGLVLVVLGVLLLVEASGWWGVGWAALAIAGVAALSLAVQVGFGTPLLGGTANSASVFLSVALVAGAVAFVRTRGADADRSSGAERSVA